MSIIGYTKEQNHEKLIEILSENLNDGWFSYFFTQSPQIEDVDNNGMSALKWAIVNEDMKSVDILLSHFSPFDTLRSKKCIDECLLKACKNGLVNIVQLLLKFGANPNYSFCNESPLLVAFSPQFITLVSSNRFGDSGTISQPEYHLNENRKKLVSMLLDSGADPHLILGCGKSIMDLSRNFPLCGGNGWTDPEIVDILSDHSGPPLPVRD